MDNNLKALCKLANIKQEALARELGVTQGVISGWSSGRYSPSAENLIQLSRILNISTDCILGLKPVPEGYPDHVAPVEYNEVIHQNEKAAEQPRDFKPTKKPPFTQEQTAYLEAMEDRIVEKVSAALTMFWAENTSTLCKYSYLPSTEDRIEIFLAALSSITPLPIETPIYDLKGSN